MRRSMAGGVTTLAVAALSAMPIFLKQTRGGGEEAAVGKALEYYIEGHATGSGSAFAKLFRPESKLFFNRDGAFTQLTSAE